MAQFKIAHGQTKNLPTTLEEGQVYVTYDNNGQNGKIFADVEIDGETTRVALEGLQGPQGVSGVYVGDGDMPEGYNVQIIPDGEATDLTGATFTPYVSDDCMLSWTNDKGLDNPDPVNIKGANGTGLYRGTVVFDEDSASSDETEIVETIDKPNGDPFIVGDMVIETNGKIWRIFDNKGHVTLVTSTKGEKGDPYTLTDTDKTEIAAKMVEMLGGNPVYAVIDENNIVTIKGLSDNESYYFKLEMEDGSTIDVGEFEPAAEPTNFIDTSSADFAINSRISNSGVNGISSGNNVSVTNYIKVEKGDIVKLDNCSSNSISNMSGGSRFAVYTGTTHNERIYNGVYSTDNGYVHTLTDNEFEIVGDNFSYVRFTIGDYSDVNQITLHIQRNGKLL